MMKTVKLLPCALLAGVSLFVACSSHSGWSLKGNVEGAEPGTRLAVEACNAGNWYVLDLWLWVKTVRLIIMRPSRLNGPKSCVSHFPEKAVYIFLCRALIA